MPCPCPDVIGLYADEAISMLEACNINFVCKSSAPKDCPLRHLRVIRQKHKSPDLIELVLSKYPTTWKGGGNGGIQNY